MKLLRMLLALCAAILLASTAVFLVSIPPSEFKSGTIVVIPKGASLSAAADVLVSTHVIRSEFAFKASAVLFGGRSSIKAGSYLFNDPETVIRVAKRIVTGDQQMPVIKVTIPEGLDSFDIANILFKNIPGFDAPAFLALAHPQEGYLFPDTYNFYANSTPDDVVTAMRADFDARTAAIADPVLAFEKSSGASAADILAMASIVEKEATNDVDRKIVAGILWKRIKSGMPLQVDPPFAYFLNKSSSELTIADLKAESPYNLYIHKGLPPTPIDNPGIDSILATVTPTESKYFFYLSDAKGTMHYAATLDGHIANRQKYLGK